MARLGLVGALAAVLTACVGPTTTNSAYQGKARQTARAMVGIVASARLTGEELLAGRVTRPFADSTVSRAEQNATSVQTAFGSRQPPDPRSDRLRDRVDRQLAAAVSALADLRIAVRRSDAGATRAALRALDGPLRAFEGLAR